MLCDGCDTPYHTDCIGLGQEVPDGAWYCMECVDHLGIENDALTSGEAPTERRRRQHPNLAHSRARRAESDELGGALVPTSGRVRGVKSQVGSGTLLASISITRMTTIRSYGKDTDGPSSSASKRGKNSSDGSSASTLPAASGLARYFRTTCRAC